MRKRDTIIEDALGMPHEVLPRGSAIQLTQLEVLLDIRDLLTEDHTCGKKVISDKE